jgi:hypothetical protein
VLIVMARIARALVLFIAISLNAKLLIDGLNLRRDRECLNRLKWLERWLLHWLTT